MRGTDPRQVAQGADILESTILLALGDQLCGNRLGQAVDLAQAEPQRYSKII